MKDESDRRTIFNECLDLNYLFTATDSLDIDAYKTGNMIRYINHAAHGYQNCNAGARFVKGNHRIFIFACRDIKKGEELFFDYMFGNKIKWIKNYNILNK
jgi:SET domain-containing protein